MSRAAVVRMVCAMSITLALAAGCSEVTPTEDPAITIAADAGDLAITVTANADEVSLVERIEVRVTSAAEPDAGPVVVVPDPMTAFGTAGWTVISVRTDPAVLDAAGRTARTVSYLLEPDLPGEYELPPLALVSVLADPPVAPAGPTESRSITVASELIGDPPEPADPLGLAPPAAAAPPPDEPDRLPLAAAICGVVGCVAGVATVAILRRRSRSMTESPADVRTRALKRLRKAARLSGAGDATTSLTDARRALAEIASALPAAGDRDSAARCEGAARTLDDLRFRTTPVEEAEARAALAAAVEVAEDAARRASNHEQGITTAALDGALAAGGRA